VGATIRRPLVVPALLVGLALAVRVAAVLATPDLPLASDPRDYDLHARSIADGEGYPPAAVGGPSAFRPPGFPVPLGAVYAITGDSLTAGRLAQALVGTALVALTGLVAFRLWGRVAALATLAVAAVYPPLVVGGLTLLTEPLFVVLELAAVAALLAARRSGRASLVAVAGLFAGLAALTRPIGPLLLPALAAGAAAAGRPGGRRRAAAMAALLVGVALLTIAPWTIRNAVVMDRFIPITDDAGYTLAGTYNETSRRDPENPAAWRVANLDPAYARLLERSRDASEAELNERLLDEVLDYIAANPEYLFDVARHNGARLLSLGGADYHREATLAETALGPRWADASLYGFLAVAALALAAIFARAARGAPGWVWWIPVLMAAGTVLVTASARFRMPIEPFLAMLAGLSLERGAALLRRNER
jgi:Dolichyl-phosphate-mannose-protein mannosyltransferase